MLAGLAALMIFAARISRRRSERARAPDRDDVIFRARTHPILRITSFVQLRPGLRGSRVFILSNAVSIPENIAVFSNVSMTPPGVPDVPRTRLLLMAVTKTHPAEKIREAYDAGLRLVWRKSRTRIFSKAAALADLHDAAVAHDRSSANEQGGQNCGDLFTQSIQSTR